MGALATLGAALTLFALGFEPFTQQIIEFPSRAIESENGTAYVNAAMEYAIPDRLVNLASLRGQCMNLRVSSMHMH